MSSPISFKLGSTWRFSGTLRDDAGAAIDLTGWSISSKLRDTSDVEVAALTCSVDPDQVAHRGEFEVHASAAATSSWSPGTVSWDVRLQDSGGDVSITRTVVVRLEQAVTR